MKTFDFTDSIDKIFAVKVTELDFSNVFCLLLVDSKAFHKVGDNVTILFGSANYCDCFVNVKQNSTKAHKKMELVLLLFEVVIKLTTAAIHSESNPLGEDFNNTHLSW